MGTDLHGHAPVTCFCLVTAGRKEPGVWDIW